MHIIKRLIIILALFGIIISSIYFVMAKKGIRFYAIGISDMALPSEVEFVQYLTNCEDITEGRILPLLAQIHSKDAARLALPSLTEACKEICCSYAESIDESNLQFRDLDDTFKIVKKLSDIENKSIKKIFPCFAGYIVNITD